MSIRPRRGESGSSRHSGEVDVMVHSTPHRRQSQVLVSDVLAAHRMLSDRSQPGQGSSSVAVARVVAVIGSTSGSDLELLAPAAQKDQVQQT
jgi:hypothetical protein